MSEENITLFLHYCCGSGMKYLKEWQKANPNEKIKAVSYFNVNEQKLHEKYGFELDSLRTRSYIVYKGKLFGKDN